MRGNNGLLKSQLSSNSPTAAAAKCGISASPYYYDLRHMVCDQKKLFF